MLSVKYVDATIQQLTKANNILLKQSPEFATLMYHKGLISSKQPYFNTHTVKEIHKAYNWYDKTTGLLTKTGKNKTIKMLNKFSCNPNVSLEKYIQKFTQTYKKLKWY